VDDLAFVLVHLLFPVIETEQMKASASVKDYHMLPHGITG